MNLKDTYNKIAANWHNDHKDDDWWVKGVNKYISLFENNDFILDLGCGAGVKAKYLSKHGLKVLGIDFSDKLIEIAKHEVPEAEFLVYDFYKINSLNYTFDGIFMQAVLLHVPKKDAQKLLCNLSRKLKKSGYLYLSVKEKRADGIDEEVIKENDYGYQYERFFSYFTLEEIKKYLIKCEFKIIFSDAISSGKSRWLQVIAKKI